MGAPSAQGRHKRSIQKYVHDNGNLLKAFSELSDYPGLVKQISDLDDPGLLERYVRGLIINESMKKRDFRDKIWEVDGTPENRIFAVYTRLVSMRADEFIALKKGLVQSVKDRKLAEVYDKIEVSSFREKFNPLKRPRLYVNGNLK